MHLNKWLLGIVLLVILGLCTVLAFVLGKNSNQTTVAVPMPIVDKARDQLKTTNVVPMSSPAQLSAAVEDKEIRLDSISDAQMTQIEAGLGCSFEKAGKYYLFSNTDQALINLDSKLILEVLNEKVAMQLINNGGTFYAQGYTVSVVKHGKEVPIEEGTNAPAQLKVIKGQAVKSIAGHWICGA